MSIQWRCCGFVYLRSPACGVSRDALAREQGKTALNFPLEGARAGHLRWKRRESAWPWFAAVCCRRADFAGTAQQRGGEAVSERFTLPLSTASALSPHRRRDSGRPQHGPRRCRRRAPLCPPLRTGHVPAAPDGPGNEHLSRRPRAGVRESVLRQSEAGAGTPPLEVARGG